MPSALEATPRRKLLILRTMPVGRDGPTQRQARFLAHNYEVTVMGLGENPFLHEPHIHWLEAQSGGSKIPGKEWKLSWYERLAPIFPKLWFPHSFLKHQHRYMAHFCQAQRWDAILCNDVDTLLPALSAKKSNRGCRIILAIRDYPTRQYESQEAWWLKRKRWAASVLRNFGREARLVLTVADAYPEMLLQEFGLKKALVIYNAPELAITQTQAVPPIDDGRLHLVHHGVGARDRELELLLQTMEHLDDSYRLNLMLTPYDPPYLEELKTLASKLGPKVIFLPHVATREIARTIAPFALGVHFQPARTFNADHAMPNKLFDFIMAGLGLVTGPYAEMTPLMAREGIGWSTDTFTPLALANKIRSLTPQDIAKAQANSRELRLRLNAEGEMAKLVAAVGKLWN